MYYPERGREHDVDIVGGDDRVKKCITPKGDGTITPAFRGGEVCLVYTSQNKEPRFQSEKEN